VGHEGGVSLGIEKSVVALGVARMADAVANSMLIVTLPLYIAAGPDDSLGLSASAETGIVLATFGVVSAFLQPIAGRLSDLAGRRRAFVLGGLFTLAGFNFLYSLASGFWLLMTIRLGQGASAAFTITGSIALVNELSDPSARGGNMGIFNALRLVGFGVGPMMAGFVVSSGPYHVLGAELGGYETVFYLATIGALVGGAMVALLVREPEHASKDVGEVEVHLRGVQGRALDPIFTLAIGTFVMAACIALLASIETRVNARLHQDARWFGIQFAAFIFSIALCQPFLGRASDHWGRKPFVVIGLLLLAPTTLAQGLVTTPVQMVVARIAQGISGAMVFAPALALAGDLVVEGQSGAQLAVVTMAFGLGLAAGQLSSGFLVHWGFVVPFAVGGVLALCAAALVHREVDEPERARA
jgi:MFS family permease